MSEPPMWTPASRDLFRQLQMVIAGHRTDDGLHAQVHSLAMCVGFASSTPEAAEKMLHDLVPDMMKSIRENWAYLAECRAQASAHRHTYHA